MSNDSSSDDEDMFGLNEEADDPFTEEEKQQMEVKKSASNAKLSIYQKSKEENKLDEMSYHIDAKGGTSYKKVSPNLLSSEYTSK